MTGPMSVAEYARHFPERYCVIVRNFGGHAVCKQEGGVLAHFTLRGDCVKALEDAGYAKVDGKWKVQRRM